jgi:S1-C subfamily serine protease
MKNKKSPQQIAAEALPSTVLLEMEDYNGQPLGVGSGFFVQEGVIATNFHVVEGAYKGSAKLFGQSERYDIEGYTASSSLYQYLNFDLQSLYLP